ncbi:MAG: DUF5050 domain-containing protein [Candidatus Poribacteria bacterium]|nr:DUF5050 domain-containing protein [Candidatus Poribacteria bacterium]
MRKFYILSFIFLFGFAFCLTNGFADKFGGFADEAGLFADDNFIPDEEFEFPTAEGADYIQDTPEFRRVPEHIIGTNDIEKMRDLPQDSPDYILGTRVGMFVVPSRNNPNRVWVCTGFLVGPDLFMTNHHCLHDDFGTLPLEDARIYMDYYEDPDVDRTRGGITAGVSEILRMDALKDYALLRLDKPIGNTYGWLELDTTTPVDSDQSVKLISHSRGRSKEISRRNSEIVDIPANHPLAAFPFALAYLADSEQGSSGSPVFLKDGIGVIGIHHSAWTRGEEPDFNAGTLMSYIVPEIRPWLPGNTTPDLVIEASGVTKDWLLPGESFTVSATVRNLGGVDSTATTLRFYESSDDSITTSDVEIGTAFVDSLALFGKSEVNVTLTASVSEGTYFYGACVDAIPNETATDNNCSTSTLVTVSTTPPVYMYWADWHTDKIQRATLNGTHAADLIVGLPHPLGIAVDVEAGHIYWTDVSEASIQRANLDGSNVQTLVTGAGVSFAITLDVEGGHIYWTDRNKRSIQRADLNGFNVQTLVTELAGPVGIALDVAGGKMYWTDWNNTTDRIQRANLDGSDVETLIPTGNGLYAPTGLALDVAGGKMYWTDSNPERIQCANLDGSNIETLVSGVDAIHIALDIDAEKMYYVAQGPGSVQRANLDGSNVETLVTGLSAPFGIALGISPVDTSPPIPPIVFNPLTIANQTFTLDTPISPLQLPVATGGTPPYTYTLSPIPDGLDFNTATQLLTGTPTTPGTTNATYTATDTTSASESLNFTIEVVSGETPILVPDDPLDVDGNGQVTVIDLAVVALFYGTQVPAGISLPADVNTDGVVNLMDLTLVAQGIDAAGGNLSQLSLVEIEAALAAAAEQATALEDAAAAPMGFSTRPDVLSSGKAYVNVTRAFADARHLAISDMLSAFLVLLTEMGAIPETTALLPNYPNPFNPETWIPYHLATDAKVTLTIYDVRGSVVRTLTLGHQPAGVYESRGRAAYWDGKNRHGEPVASGVYFYTLTAGDFTATRKLLIAK